jgi:hypothetical protein
MPYEKSLDVELFKEVKDFENTRITVGVYSYNNGEKKLQVTRENKRADDEWRFAKLGRLTLNEAKEIIPIMMKAIENMEA